MKRYFILLAILNLIDMAATAIGIELNVIREANPLMDFLWQRTPLLFIGVKTIFSFLLILVMIYIKIQPKNVWKWKLFLVTTIAGYLWLMVLHAKWIMFFFKK